MKAAILRNIRHMSNNRELFQIVYLKKIQSSWNAYLKKRAMYLRGSKDFGITDPNLPSFWCTVNRYRKKKWVKVAMRSSRYVCLSLLYNW